MAGYKIFRGDPSSSEGGCVRALIVGAGAVGIVYGFYLQKAGAEVSFLVKERHRSGLRDGVRTYVLKMWGRYATTVFSGYGVYSDVAELRGREFDLVVLTVASDALEHSWLASLARSVGETSRVLTLQPDINDRAKIDQHFPPDRVTQGLINFLSFQAPLAGAARPLPEDSPPGIAWFLVRPSGHFEASETGRWLQAELAKGGFHATVIDDLPGVSARRTARSIPVTAVLELADWKLARLVSPQFWSLAMASSREAEAVVSGAALKERALSRSALRHVLRLALPIIKRMAPFDIEGYLAFHFTKVGPQTLLVLDTLIEAGGGTPSRQVEALRFVRDRLRTKRAEG